MKWTEIFATMWAATKEQSARELIRIALVAAVISLLMNAADWIPKLAASINPKWIGAANLSPVLYMLAIVVLIGYISHLIRRIVFNRVDLQELMIVASATPLGAAIVVAAICYVLATFVQVSVALLR